MKYILTLSLLFVTWTAGANTPSVPTLFFSYSSLYDSVCSNTPERKIEPEWAQEARTRTPEFKATWERLGPVFFGKVFEIFGFGFSRKEMTATLSVCPASSYSSPLVLTVNRFLTSYMKEKPTRTQDEFADLVFHELLHTWVVEHTDWPTPMILKYQSELPVTRNHLHLMAVQKLIYQQLGRHDLIQMNEVNYARNPAYKRALEIVNLEGISAFTNELQP